MRYYWYGMVWYGMVLMYVCMYACMYVCNVCNVCNVCMYVCMYVCNFLVEFTGWRAHAIWLANIQRGGGWGQQGFYHTWSTSDHPDLYWIGRENQIDFHIVSWQSWCHKAPTTGGSGEKLDLLVSTTVVSFFIDDCSLFAQLILGGDPGKD